MYVFEKVFVRYFVQYTHMHTVTLYSVHVCYMYVEARFTFRSTCLYSIGCSDTQGLNVAVSELNTLLLYSLVKINLYTVVEFQYVHVCDCGEGDCSFFLH